MAGSEFPSLAGALFPDMRAGQRRLWLIEPGGGYRTDLRFDSMTTQAASLASILTTFGPVQITGVICPVPSIQIRARVK